MKSGCREALRRALLGAALCLAVPGALAQNGGPAADADSAVATGLPKVVILKPGRPVSAVSSAALTLQAWRALEKEDLQAVFRITEECEERFAPRARKQQEALKDFAPKEKAFNYAVLNDVATALFIRGKALRRLARHQEAKELYQHIIRDYRFAQCWDPRGWFWRVAAAAQDEVNCIDYSVDFGDYSSATLTMKAWQAFSARKYEAVELYVRKCVELYSPQAKQMQEQLDDFAPKGQEFDFWALNDVATCLFIRGRALQRQSRSRDAMLVYQDILSNYSFAQCWDPNGWFWKVAEAARRNCPSCS